VGVQFPPPALTKRGSV